MTAKNKNRRERNLAELRRKYGHLDSPLRESEDYSVDLLATVAAQLLIGSDYDEAITRAVKLLDACQKYVTERWIDAVRPKLLDKRRHVPFKDAVKDITGYLDAEYARETFYEFFAAIISHLYGGGPVDKQEFEALVQRHIDQGFAPETVILLNTLFFRYWPIIQKRLPKKAQRKRKRKSA
jgi:hypothetical protein